MKIQTYLLASVWAGLCACGSADAPAATERGASAGASRAASEPPPYQSGSALGKRAPAKGASAGAGVTIPSMHSTSPLAPFGAADPLASADPEVLARCQRIYRKLFAGMADGLPPAEKTKMQDSITQAVDKLVASCAQRPPSKEFEECMAKVKLGEMKPDHVTGGLVECMALAKGGPALAARLKGVGAAMRAKGAFNDMTVDEKRSEAEIAAEQDKKYNDVVDQMKKAEKARKLRE